jgi:hypothetical protein
MTSEGAMQIGSALSRHDRWGACLTRWSIGRMRYRVEPGLYALGSPDAGSPVLVTANYKMSFDRLRSSLPGRNAWILVLDTKGINVWCAAGKGTFGTDELVARIEAVGLKEIVNHRKLILPQLGAPGVAAHVVKQRSGFKVVYGPVRAEDLPAFLDAGLEADPEMRRVRFPMRDRLALIPVELVQSLKIGIPAMVILTFVSGIGPGVYSLQRTLQHWPLYAILVPGTILTASTLVPALLPWLPGKPFALKGAWVGLSMALGYLLWGPLAPWGMEDPWTTAGLCLKMIALSSFIGMNFTGASTFTSLSGVRKEMAVAIPLQILVGTAGLGLWIAGRFL